MISRAGCRIRTFRTTPRKAAPRVTMHSCRAALRTIIRPAPGSSQACTSQKAHKALTAPACSTGSSRRACTSLKARKALTAPACSIGSSPQACTSRRARSSSSLATAATGRAPRGQKGSQALDATLRPTTLPTRRTWREASLALPPALQVHLPGSFCVCVCVCVCGRGLTESEQSGLQRQRDRVRWFRSRQRKCPSGLQNASSSSVASCGR